MKQTIEDILKRPSYTNIPNNITGCMAPDRCVLDYDEWETRIRNRLMEDSSFCEACARLI